MSRGIAFWLVGMMLGFFLFAAAAPSPLYVIYQARFGFSASTLTAVFAVYAMATLAALMAVGSLSDHLGRRPVLAGALLLEMAAMAIFAGAAGVGWLYAARIVQGLGTGVGVGVIGAALIDLAPESYPGLGPVVNTVAISAGLGIGGLGAGALVQYAPAPTLLVYLVLLGVFAVGLLGTPVMPEPVSGRGRGWRRALRPSKPTVPGPARRRFAMASTGLVASFALSGLYLSLGPSLAASLLGLRSHLAGGLVVFTLFATGALGQTVLRSWPARRAVPVGAVAIVVGLGITDWSLSAPSTAAFFTGGAVLGAGFGLSLMGAYRVMADLAEPERRAEVISATYVVVYLSLGVPAVLAGVAATQVGLHTAMVSFSVGVGILSVLAGIGGLAGEPVAGLLPPARVERLPHDTPRGAAQRKLSTHWTHGHSRPHRSEDHGRAGQGRPDAVHHPGQGP